LAGNTVVSLTTTNDRSISEPTGLKTQQLTLRDDPFADTTIVAGDKPITEYIIDY
jgi:hypothetical protein